MGSSMDSYSPIRRQVQNELDWALSGTKSFHHMYFYQAAIRLYAEPTLR